MLKQKRKKKEAFQTASKSAVTLFSNKYNLLRGGADDLISMLQIYTYIASLRILRSITLQVRRGTKPTTQTQRTSREGNMHYKE